MPNKLIKATMKTDLESYHAFACCCHLTKENLNSMGFSDRRIVGHLHDNLIKEKNVWNNSSKKFDKVYVPTKFGSKYMGEKIGMSSKNFYVSQSPFHDSALYKVYSKCEYKDTWKTENQLRDQLTEEIERLRSNEEYDRLLELEMKLEEKMLSPIDGSYMVEGQQIGVEICTENYSDQDKECKANFCEAINAQKEFYQI